MFFSRGMPRVVAASICPSFASLLFGAMIHQVWGEKKKARKGMILAGFRAGLIGRARRQSEKREGKENREGKGYAMAMVFFSSSLGCGCGLGTSITSVPFSKRALMSSSLTSSPT